MNMRTYMNKIAVTLTLIIGISCLLTAQESEAPKVLRDSTKNRYTLYPASTETEPPSSILKGNQTNIDTDTIFTGGVKSPVIMPAVNESGSLQTPVTESGLPIAPVSPERTGMKESGAVQTPVTESGLPIAPVSPERTGMNESGAVQTPVTESGLPMDPVSPERTGMNESGAAQTPVTESGLPIAPVSSEKTGMNESGAVQTPVTESGLPVMPEIRGSETGKLNTPVSPERQSGVTESVITQPGVLKSSPAPSSGTNSQGIQNKPTQIPASSPATNENKPDENKVQTSSDGPIRDWSNPPGFVGYAPVKQYKMVKHKHRTKKHTYHPHRKYQHKNRRIRSPRF